jgi:hypothetical protein
VYSFLNKHKKIVYAVFGAVLIACFFIPSTGYKSGALDSPFARSPVHLPVDYVFNFSILELVASELLYIVSIFLFIIGFIQLLRDKRLVLLFLISFTLAFCSLIVLVITSKAVNASATVTTFLPLILLLLHITLLILSRYFSTRPAPEKPTKSTKPPKPPTDAERIAVLEQQVEELKKNNPNP